MSPSRKRLLCFLAAAGTLGGVAAAGALWHVTRPEVQRALVLDALRRAGWSGDIGAVTARLSGAVSVSAVDLTDPDGRRFTLKRADATVALWSALTGDPHVEKLVVQGLLADLSAARSASAGGGAFRHVKVDSADVAGRVKLAGGRSLDLDLRARNVDTRSGGTLVFRVVDAAGPVFTGEARVRFSETAPGAAGPSALWASLNPVVTAEAEARPEPGAPVAATLALSADAAGATLRVKAGEGGADLRLTPAANGVFTLAGKVALDRSALAPWLKSRTPPGFFTKGDFLATYDPATRAVDAAADFSGEADAPQWGPAGLRAFAVSASVSGVPGGSWRIRKFHAQAGSPEAPGALVAEAAGVTLHPQDRRLVETAPGSAAVVRVARAPLAWLNPFLPAGAPEFSSGELSGELRLTRDASGEMTLDSGDGLSAARVSLTKGGVAYLDDLTLTLPVRAQSAAGGALAATVSKARLRRGGEAVLTADLDWKSDATGAGVFNASASVSPGALPADFLPGGACGFCREAGLRFEGGASVRVSASGAPAVERARVEGVTREGVRAFAAELSRPLDARGVPADGRAFASFAFRGTPLALFNPFLGGPALGGVAESGDFQVSRTPAGWQVSRTSDGAAVFVRGLSWTDASGAPVVAPGDVRTSLRWEQTAGGWRLNLGELAWDCASGRALGGEVSLEKSGAGVAALNADLSGDVVALGAVLPAARRLRVVSGAYSLKAAHRADGDSSLDLALSRLRASAGAPESGATLAAKVARAGGVTRFTAPVLLNGPSGATRVTLDGTLRAAGGRSEWDAALTGGNLFVDDWRALFSGDREASWDGPSPSKPEAAAPAKPDAAPFWAGHTGRFTASLESVRFSGETVAQPRLSLSARPMRLTADDFSAQVRGLPVKGDAVLLFNAGVARPYALSAKGAATSLPVGKIVEAMSPKASGWVDGDFDLTFGASGQGATAGDLLNRVEYSATAESREGTLRFFRADNEAVRLSGEIAGVAGDLAGDLGRMLGGKAPGVGRLLDGASVLQRALSLVKYRRLSVSVKRLPDGALEIPKAELVADLLRLNASGTLGPAQGAAFSDRHAVVSARLDGRDMIAEALRGLGRAEEKAGADGWLAGPELRYDGPLNNVRNNLLNNLFRAVSVPTLKDAVKSLPGAAKKVPEGAADVLDKVLDLSGVGL